MRESNTYNYKTVQKIYNIAFNDLTTKYNTGNETFHCAKNFFLFIFLLLPQYSCILGSMAKVLALNSSKYFMDPQLFDS